MSPWEIKRTETFLAYLKKHKNNHELLSALSKKIQHLQEDPFSVGGFLCGHLHGFKSTRLIKNFRLMYHLDEENNIVYLDAVDHRKDVYD